MNEYIYSNTQLNAQDTFLERGARNETSLKGVIITLRKMGTGENTNTSITKMQFIIIILFFFFRNVFYGRWTATLPRRRPI